jgi:hypothetical protein
MVDQRDALVIGLGAVVSATAWGVVRAIRRTDDCERATAIAACLP